MLAGLYDPSARLSMANTAEELARRYRITREEADAFGLRSHQNAKRSRDAGWFAEEIAPVEVRRDGAAAPVVVQHDTHILEEPSLASMAKLPPAFEPGGIVTAGNASAVVDGAAAMVLGKEEDVVQAGMRPLARLAGLGVAGCAPEIMGWGPVPATKRALAQAGIRGQDLDLVELNEAFAPQALACIRDFAAMGIDPEKVNPMGNAIALGHPLGATGANLTLTAAYALRRTRKKHGLVTMCIGGGQGISLVLESLA
jgi:acetyl-CoA acetyltransferase family protein